MHQKINHRNSTHALKDKLDLQLGKWVCSWVGLFQRENKTVQEMSTAVQANHIYLRDWSHTIIYIDFK